MLRSLQNLSSDSLWRPFFFLERLSRASFLTFAVTLFPEEYSSQYSSYEYLFLAAATAFGGTMFLAADALQADSSKWTVALATANLMFAVPMLLILSTIVKISPSSIFDYALILPFVLMPFEWFLGLSRRFEILTVRVCFNFAVILAFAAAYQTSNIFLMQLFVGGMFFGPGICWFVFAARYLQFPSSQTISRSLLFVLNNLLVFWVARSEILVSLFHLHWEPEAFIGAFRPLVYFSGFVQLFVSYAFIGQVSDGILHKVLRYRTILAVLALMLLIELGWYFFQFPVSVSVVLIVVVGFTASALNSVLASFLLRKGRLFARTLAIIGGIVTAVVSAYVTKDLSALWSMAIVFTVSQLVVSVIYSFSLKLDECAKHSDV